MNVKWIMQKIVNQKNNLRKEILKQRDCLLPKFKLEYDSWICDQLKQLVQEHRFVKIHTYLPMRSEIDIAPFIQYLLDKNIEVYCPKTLNHRKLRHFRLESLDEVSVGKFGTPYPSSEIASAEEFDLIVVPGVAYDKEAYRLGYGGGYYDAFLEAQPTAMKVGIAYPFQIRDALPKEKHDAKLSKIILRPTMT